MLDGHTFVNPHNTEPSSRNSIAAGSGVGGILARVLSPWRFGSGARGGGMWERLRNALRQEDSPRDANFEFFSPRGDSQDVGEGGGGRGGDGLGGRRSSVVGGAMAMMRRVSFHGSAVRLAGIGGPRVRERETHVLESLHLLAQEHHAQRNV
jgi:hypothetical protein